MIDLAALPQPVAAPAASAAPLQNGGNVAESGDSAASAPGLAFDALLAMQIAPAAPADAPLPESGKILPDAAKVLAALPQVRTADMPVRQQTTKAAAEAAPSDDDAEDTAEHADMALPDPTLPNAAFMAALLSAPDRLAAPQETASATSVDGPRAIANPAANAASGPAAAQPSPSHAAIALARTAQIELTTTTEPASDPVPTETPVAAPTAQIMAARQVRQNKSAGAADGEVSDVAKPASPVAAAKPGTDRDPAETPRVEAPSTTSLLADRAQATPDTAPAAAVRSETRTERVDFATLVDTLARAREEASPGTVTASVNHAEFGRVTLRFDHDEDRGMSVAMSSADPGFARAVGATTEGARTPTESTGQNAQGQTQAQSQTQTQAGQGESQRQPPREAQQAQARPFANTATSRREDEAPRTRSDDRGIYA